MYEELGSRTPACEVKKTGRAMWNIHIARATIAPCARRRSPPTCSTRACCARSRAGAASGRYPAQAVLINEGDATDSLFILLSGRVKVYSTNADGKEVVITIHGAGEYVGELALDGGVRSASVMTLEPTTCSVVSGASLREFIAAHPDFASHLIRKLIRSVRQATESVKSLALEDVYARVVRLLAELSDPVDGGAARGARAADAAGHRRSRRRVARDGEPDLQGPDDRRLHRRQRAAGSSSSGSLRPRGEPRWHDAGVNKSHVGA